MKIVNNLVICYSILDLIGRTPMLTFSTTEVGRFSNLYFLATKPTRHR
jgi:hypothetical protein